MSERKPKRKKNIEELVQRSVIQLKINGSKMTKESSGHRRDPERSWNRSVPKKKGEVF